VPRAEGLSDLQREGLEVLARAVMQRLQAHRSDLANRAESDENARRFAMLADNIPDVAWSCSAEGEFDFFNARWHEVTGSEGPRQAEAWRPLVHPDDAEAAFASWHAAFTSGAAFATEFRLLHGSGEWRWVLSRALPMHDDEGRIVRWFGTLTEIDEVRRLSEQRDLLARELSHRIKNIFAVIGGLIALRARHVTDASALADELGDTIRALGRANDYVRPLDGRKGRRLVGLLDELMAPYRRGGRARVEIEGVDCPIGARAATPLALVFHELATNSAKYGALSSEDGTVRLATEFDRDAGLVQVRWHERGGPPPASEPGEGFGSRLVRMSIEGQLDGRIERRWTPEGLDIELSIPLKSLAD
jgi:PAS domain S-box-containing protein